MKKRLTKSQADKLQEILLDIFPDPADVSHWLRSANRYSAYQKFVVRGERPLVVSANSFDEIINGPAKKEPEIVQPLQEPKRRMKKKITTVQLDPDQLDRLRELAEEQERSVSALIRIAVREYLKGV